MQYHLVSFFKLLSYISHKNECLRIKELPDINAILSQFFNEEKLNPDIASNYGNSANDNPLDIDDLSIGANYVPIKVEILIQNQENNFCKLSWDVGNNIQQQFIKPAFPIYLYPLQKCNIYGYKPYTIPLYQSNGPTGKDTSILWLMTGMLI